MTSNMSDDQTNWGGVIFGLGLSTLAAFTQFKMAPVLSEMAALYGYTPLISGSYMSIYAVAGLFLARWFGHHMHDKDVENLIRNILLLAFFATLLGFLMAENSYVMLISRALEGIAACGLSILGPAVIVRFTDQSKQSTAAAITALWVPLGVVSAGLFSLWPESYLFMLSENWQLNWVISLIFTVVLLGSLLLFQQRHIPILKPRNKTGNMPNQAASSLWESHPHKQANMLAAITFLFWSGQNIAFMSWLPSYLIENLGYTQDKAAIIFIIPVVFLGIFNLLAAPIMKILPPGKLLYLSIAGQGITAFLLVFMTRIDQTILQFLLLLGYGAFAGITPSCLFRMPNLIFGSQSGTRSFGQIIFGRNIGVLAGPMVVAFALQFSETKWESLGLTIISSCLLATIMAFILSRKLQTLDSV